MPSRKPARSSPIIYVFTSTTSCTMGSDGERERVPPADREYPASDLTWTAGSAAVDRDFAWTPSAPGGANPVHPAISYLRTLAVALVAVIAASGLVLAGPPVVAVLEDVSGPGGAGSPTDLTTGAGLGDRTETASATEGAVRSETDSPAGGSSPSAGTSPTATRTPIPSPTMTGTPTSSPTATPDQQSGGPVSNVADDDGNDGGATDSPTEVPTPTDEWTEAPTPTDRPTATDEPTTTDSPTDTCGLVCTLQ